MRYEELEIGDTISTGIANYKNAFTIEWIGRNNLLNYEILLSGRRVGGDSVTIVLDLDALDNYKVINYEIREEWEYYAEQGYNRTLYDEEIPIDADWVTLTGRKFVIEEDGKLELVV